MPAVLHAADVVVPVCAAPVRDGGVLVDGDRVVAVGPRAGLEPRAAEVRTHTGVLTPGLVNAHAHLEYGPAFADLATSGLPFARWIAELTVRRRELTPADWLEQARASVAALLRGGTTCVADVVSEGPGLQAAAESGLPGVSYVEAVGADDRRWAEHERARVLRLLDGAPPQRPVGLSPHTLYTLGTRVFREVADLARARGLRLHPHLAESAEEVAYVAAGTGAFAGAMTRLGLAFELLESGGSGRTPTRELDALGALGPHVHVAHGVHVDADDRALLRDRGVTVALCPRSNAVLGAGEAPVAAYVDEASPVAVGTDSLASTPSLDLLADLAALHALAARQGCGTADLARRLVEAATVGGARALGLDDVGVLRPGSRADLAVFAVPVGGDPYAALVAYGAGSCTATVLGGVPAYERMAA